MPENLSSQLEKYLPQPLLKLVTDAGAKAGSLGLKLYLVGGVVRDLFLGRPNFDLDLLVEGDAIKLAQELAKKSQAKLTVHQRFGTAKLTYSNFSLDLATARGETYSHPGALPTVKPGSIKDDLIRRDFSINAMAISLTPQDFGELTDLYHGKDDLKHGLIRILHPNSFTDDATRILRALRYEQRLNFKLEPDTEKLLRRDVALLDTISGDRLSHELELILKEDCPERVLLRAEKLGVLSKLQPSLKGDGWLSQKFGQVRRLDRRISPVPIYLCLLVYSLSQKETGQPIARLNFPKGSAQAMRHALKLKAQLDKLDNPKLKPGEIYGALHSYTTQAIRANLVAAESQIARQHLKLYLSKLYYVKPLLNGDDLKKMGVPEGPQMGKLLNALHQAKLNGEVTTRAEEEKLVRNWRQSNQIRPAKS